MIRAIVLNPESRSSYLSIKASKVQRPPLWPSPAPRTSNGTASMPRTSRVRGTNSKIASASMNLRPRRRGADIDLSGLITRRGRRHGPVLRQWKAEDRQQGRDRPRHYGKALADQRRLGRNETSDLVDSFVEPQLELLLAGETANPLQPALCLCELRRFRSVPATELLDCIRKVIADRAPGQEECASYLVEVCPTVGGRKYLAFSFGQRAHALAERRSRQARIDDALAPCCAPDGVCELLWRCVLEQKAVRPRFHRSAQKAGFAEGRQDETAAVRQALTQRSC